MRNTWLALTFDLFPESRMIRLSPGAFLYARFESVFPNNLLQEVYDGLALVEDSGGHWVFQDKFKTEHSVRFGRQLTWIIIES